MLVHGWLHALLLFPHDKNEPKNIVMHYKGIHSWNRMNRTIGHRRRELPTRTKIDKNYSVPRCLVVLSLPVRKDEISLSLGKPLFLSPAAYIRSPSP